MPSETRAFLDKGLDSTLVGAGEFLGLDAAEFSIAALFSCVLLGTLGAGVSVLWGATWAWVLGGCSLGFIYPISKVLQAKALRQRSIERALPSIMDLMYMALGGGLDFYGALTSVVQCLPNKTAPIRCELKRVLDELTLGTSRAEALKNFARRNPAQTASEFAHWVIQSEEKGTPLRKILRRQANSLRQKRTVCAEESAAKAGAALMFPMMLMFICVLILVTGPLIAELKRSTF